MLTDTHFVSPAQPDELMRIKSRLLGACNYVHDLPFILMTASGHVHTVHLRIIARFHCWHFELLKKFLLIYTSSTFATEDWRTCLLRACTHFLTTFRGDSGAETINVDFPEGGISADSNGLYTSDRSWGMLKRNDSGQLDSVLPFFAALVNRGVGEQHCVSMTHMHINLS